MFILMVNVTNFGFDYRKEKLFKNEKTGKKYPFFDEKKFTRCTIYHAVLLRCYRTVWTTPNLIQT